MRHIGKSMGPEEVQHKVHSLTINKTTPQMLRCGHITRKKEATVKSGYHQRIDDDIEESMRIQQSHIQVGPEKNETHAGVRDALKMRQVRLA
ncbi:hypothetical protein RB195_011767 [Necator americanus]|uniref:Uncharacterized protein n=1 Tax=Necator americanus TaxID=51031 RepID=A0ABR1D3Y7_NECAM